MEIKFKNIVLRDMTEKDIDDEIRWNTVETDWAHWDAPWESEPELLTFDAEKHRKKELEFLLKPKSEPRWGFEIDFGDKHIGAVSSYLMNENFEWTPLKTAEKGEKLFRAVGIGICESSFCEKGLGTNALCAFIKYYLGLGEREIYTQTWSGNLRMIRCAEKLGFEECMRKKDFRFVHGKRYDGLSFKLNLKKFEEFLKK